MPVSVTTLGDEAGERGGGREREDEGESKVERNKENRQRVGGGNESGGGSRLSARALSIPSASRRTRNYSSIERRSSLAQLTPISRGFFFSRPPSPSSSPPPPHPSSFHGTCFFAASRPPRRTRSHPVHRLRDCAASCPHRRSYMSSVFRFVCGNYGGCVEPAARRRCAIRNGHRSIRCFPS